MRLHLWTFASFDDVLRDSSHVDNDDWKLSPLRRLYSASVKIHFDPRYR